MARGVGKYLQIFDDTLSFQDRQYSSEDNYSKLRVKRRDFQIISLSDSFLTTSPISELAENIFVSDTISFIRQEFAIDQNIRFEKITFHTTSCYGDCSIYHLEIKSNGKIRLHREEVYKQKDRGIYVLDTLNIGYYSGTISKNLLNELEQEIKTINLENLEFKSHLCCDESTKTVIINYNGKRKYFKDMFPPRMTTNIIHLLYRICEGVELQETEIQFELEK